MRVIGGEFRSRRLKTLPGRTVRPTSDRLRETLFNVLGDEIAGKVFVDAFAGSGAVGIEALSRGAGRAVFIENNRQAAGVILANLRALNLDDRATVIQRPALEALSDLAAGIVFLDPPYSQAEQYRVVLGLLGQAPPPLVIAEHFKRLDLQPAYGALRRVRLLGQGDSALSFFRPAG